MQILYIDDDPSYGFMARRMLERIGHEVTLFNAPLTALDALLARPDGWDMVITDFRMPDLSGLDVARVLRDRHPALLCVVISHYTGGTTTGEAVAAGLQPVLPKPASTEGFADLIAQALARGGAAV